MHHLGTIAWQVRDYVSTTPLDGDPVKHHLPAPAAHSGLRDANLTVIALACRQATVPDGEGKTDPLESSTRRAVAGRLSNHRSPAPPRARGQPRTEPHDRRPRVPVVRFHIPISATTTQYVTREHGDSTGTSKPRIRAISSAAHATGHVAQRSNSLRRPMFASVMRPKTRRQGALTVTVASFGRGTAHRTSATHRNVGHLRRSDRDAGERRPSAPRAYLVRQRAARSLLSASRWVRSCPMSARAAQRARCAEMPNQEALTHGQGCSFERPHPGSRNRSRGTKRASYGSFTGSTGFSTCWR